MKLHRFFSIFLIMLLILGCVSCSSTRRASRQIDRILNKHPELLSYDTVRIDTIVPVLVAADTVIIPEIILDSGEVVVHHTDHGTFHVQKLPGRKIKIIYQPDTLNMRVRETFAVPKLTIEEEHKTSITEVIKWLVIGIIVVLFARLLLKK